VAARYVRDWADSAVVTDGTLRRLVAVYD